jgi:hypothetical protein
MDVKVPHILTTRWFLCDRTIQMREDFGLNSLIYGHTNLRRPAFVPGVKYLTVNPRVYTPIHYLFLTGWPVTPWRIDECALLPG